MISGCLLNIHPSDIMFTGWLPKVSVYKICPDDPSKRIELNSYNPSQLQYFHSWGLSENFVITTHQPFTIDVWAMIMVPRVSQSGCVCLCVFDSPSRFVLKLMTAEFTIARKRTQALIVHLLQSLVISMQSISLPACCAYREALS